MKTDEAPVGVRVWTLWRWAGIPKGMEGVIDEDYGSGVTVAWDLPNRPLPHGWRFEGQWAGETGVPLRDEFHKATELGYLEVVR